MNWLVLAFALTLGYTPNDNEWQYSPPPQVWSTESALIVCMDAEVRAWNALYAGGSLGVPVWSVPGGYWPQSLQSVIRAGVRFGGVEVGWSHLCSHPVMPFQPMYDERTLWEGGYDEFHVKFSAEVHL